jgi:predicted methyltransferase
MPAPFLLAAILMFSQHDDHAARHMDHKFDPAESARSFDDPARDAWQKPDQVIAALGLKPGQSVADVGAGTGYFTVRLAKSQAAPKVYASDLEPAMVDYLRKRAAKEKLTNVIAVQASASSPNLPEPVDAILIVNTWHHIANREAYFKALTKSLKPGGRLAIVDYVKGAPMGPPEHFRFTPAEIKAELSKAGYRLTAEHKFLPNQQFLVFQPAR